MSETVVDALIVRLGLDPTSYRKGVADATRAQKTLQENTKKSGAEITDSLKAVTRQVAAMVLGFESLRGAIGFLAGINTADAALGRFAKDTGVSVHELNTWGLAVEQNGGKAEALQGDVASLASSITDFKAGRGISDLLALVQRAGVAIFDAEGKTRNLFDILRETGGYLRQFKAADAFALGRSAGVSRDTLELILQQEEAVKRRLADAERQNNLDEEGAKRAAELQKKWTELVQGAREFGRAINEAIFPAVMSFMKALEPVKPILLDIINSLKDTGAFEGLAHGITHAAEALKLAVDGWKELIALMPSASEKIADVAEAVKDKSAFGTHFVRDLVFGSNTGPAANTGPVVKGTERSPAALAASAQARRQAAYQARQAAGSGGNTTTVHVDNIEVHTQATDSDAIAADISGALNRKLVIGQADTGMN